MDRRLTGTLHRIEITPPPESDIYTVRKWGDPVLVDLMGSSTAIVNTSNFQVVQTASIGDNEKPFFNCVSRFQITDYDYLESLQYPSDGYTVEQKMRWLVYYDGKARSPYWMDGTPILYFGPLVFGGQKVMLGETIVKWGKYPNRGSEEWIELRRVLGVRRADFGKYSYAKEPWFIQRATVAYRTPTEDYYFEYPRGEIFHPVWSDLDYPTNYGDHKMWLATRLVEEL